MRPRVGAIFIFSLLLVIVPSNININIFILIKEIQTNISAKGVQYLYFFIIRDRTYKLKY